MRFAKSILLTGAGFTKSFGGFLGSEMWGLIFNQPEVRADDQLRTLMLERGFNYERIFEQVLDSSKYSDPQRAAFNDATRRAYEDMDSAIYEYATRNVSGRSCCKSFISPFGRVRDGRPFFFTLNQDIFIERFFSTENFLIVLPGLHCPKWFNARIGPTLAAEDQVRLPTEAQLEPLKKKFWNKENQHFDYIKLHGSYGWKAHDGSEVMVIGEGKRGRIEKEPLLQWYLSLFEESLSEGEKNLVVIGYGFADEHINNIIADAINDARLRLFVISPLRAEDFYLELTSVSKYKLRAHEIWKGLHGYYCDNITNLFPLGDVPQLGQKLFHDIDLT